jgi:hypothetical protein
VLPFRFTNARAEIRIITQAWRNYGSLSTTLYPRTTIVGGKDVKTFIADKLKDAAETIRTKANLTG